MQKVFWEDDFTTPDLDAVWIDGYLPGWSSRAAARAHYRIDRSVLRLSIPSDHPLWCAESHPSPLRVSGVQSGNWSGPKGSTRGQQPFREGLTVQEEQPEHWGWTPRGGLIEVRARMDIDQRSMASAWLIGREVDPEECAEICIFEIFGRDCSNNGTVQIGMGLHAFRDPRTPEDFEKISLKLNPSEWHTYAVRWTEHEAIFSIDGVVYKTAANPPWYPMQMELAVFDFPEWSSDEDDQYEPVFEIDWIRESNLQ